MGKELHPSGNGPDRSGQDAAYARMIARALRRELGGSHQAVKQLMRWTGASERTAKNWLAGACGPSGAHLIAIMAQSDEVLSSVLAHARRRPALIAGQVLAARTKLIDALARIDDLLGGNPG
jgi:hypothetical protein